MISKKWTRCAAATGPCGARKLSDGAERDGAKAGGVGALVQPPRQATAAHASRT